MLAGYSCDQLLHFLLLCYFQLVNYKVIEILHASILKALLSILQYYFFFISISSSLKIFQFFLYASLILHHADSTSRLQHILSF